MKLSKDHGEILASLATNYKTGRSQSRSQLEKDSHELNIINPPVNCPKWACIILPCINHVPSMKLFKSIVPREAEVRVGKRWVCYDANSLNVGDIVRFYDGDTIPADVSLLNLGLDFVDDGNDSEGQGDGNSDRNEIVELIVDSSQIDGKTKPKTIGLNEDGTVDAVELYAGSQILQGEGIAVVTKIGRDVMLSRLIKSGQWPPKGSTKAGWQAVNQMDDEDGHEQELV